jgi:hypothetical protein
LGAFSSRQWAKVVVVVVVGHSLVAVMVVVATAGVAPVGVVAAVASDAS